MLKSGQRIEDRGKSAYAKATADICSCPDEIGAIKMIWRQDDKENEKFKIYNLQFEI